MADAWLEGMHEGREMGRGLSDAFFRGRELKERMKERHDAIDVAAQEKHHQLNKEAAEASRQTERDYRGQQDSDEEQRRYDSGAGMRSAQERIAKAEAANLEKGRPKTGNRSATASNDPKFQSAKHLYDQTQISLRSAKRDQVQALLAGQKREIPKDVISKAKAAETLYKGVMEDYGLEIPPEPPEPDGATPWDPKGLGLPDPSAQKANKHWWE